MSEAYFARLLDLPFIAVMPRNTSRPKVAAIEAFRGQCHFVDHPGQVYAEAQAIADARGGYYLDQFTYAERATDWRGNNNIAESIFRQLSDEPRPVPDWIVMSAGTGGTSATLGRYIRYRNLDTRLCVVDVEGSAFYDAWQSGDMTTTGAGSRIEGIGRPRVEPSFMPHVIDRMIRIPDAASIAAARVLSERLFRRVGGSTGTNFMGVLCLAAQMRRDGREGALATVICDSGDRYEGTYFNDAWLGDQGIDIAGWSARITRFLDTGEGAFLQGNA